MLGQDSLGYAVMERLVMLANVGLANGKAVLERYGLVPLVVDCYGMAVMDSLG